MAGPAGDNILKVLSGNQYGVEVALPDGTYSFGSGAEADIQLLDVSLQPLHGQVRLRDGKIELRTMGGDLTTASGLSLTKGGDDWNEIAQMDAVSAGLSKFVIGGPGANWTALTPAAVPRPSPSRGFGDLVSLARSVPRRVALAAGAGVAVLVLVALVAGSGSDATERGPMDARTAVANLQTTVKAMPFASAVTVLERADGTLAIEGYVEEPVERRAIQNALDQSGLAGTLQVFVRKNLRADIEGTIQSLQVPATFTLDPNGSLTLTGTVLDPAKAEKLVTSIETGVFGLASVTSEIRTADQILDDLRGIAAKAGLGSLVIFRLDGLVVEATGIVPRDKMDNWAGLIGVYSRRFAQDLPLRSFVTLDQPAATDTAPIIFGSGPVAEAESGRMVAPETLSEPSEVDARSLFAGQPTSPSAESVQDTLIDRLRAAMARLRDLQPGLYRKLEADVKAGRVPDTDSMQEAMRLLGGSLRNTGRLVEGTPEIVVETAEFGSLGTLKDLEQRLPVALGVVAAAAPAVSAPPVPLAMLDTSRDAAPAAAAAPALAPDPALPTSAALAPTSAALAPASALASATVAPVQEAAPAQTAVPAVSDAPTPSAVLADTALLPEPAVSQAQAPAALVIPVQPADVPAAGVAQAGQAITTPSLPEPDGFAATAGAGNVPYYALPQGEALSLGRIMAAAEQVVGSTEAPSAAGVSPDLRQLVGLQQEQLQMGRTLMRLPRPLSALPTTAEKPVTCWEGSALSPAAVPITLLVLDVMSVSSDLDMARSDPVLRDALMEAALSPQRVRSCLNRTNSSYAAAVAASSAFLTEIERNPSFAEFLFRSVPKAEVPLAGANLTGDRYVELRDGRKLHEGSAPDISSRIMTIGDAGVLLRTAEGTKVQLFGDAIGWRVVDACESSGCRVN